MRNLKRALSLGLTAAMISGLMVMGSSAASYADVTSENNVEAIEVLESVGIMIGDENGNFNPDQNVTRNEMAVVMSNLMEYNVASYRGTSPFTDVPSWAEPYVAACWTNGITAGTSATTYGGDQTVTTAQAALMLMKALGYFQYSSDFGSDWQLATVRQGNDIDLFMGVDSGVEQAMTRNDVAQLVLNTLEAGTVQATTNGSITVGGVTIATNVEYNFVTSNADYAYAISSAMSTDQNTDAQRSIVELGEELYQGDLMKRIGEDDFGRPSSIWTYNNDEVGVYPDAATYTYTEAVAEEDLYDTLGNAIMQGNNNYNQLPYAWDIYYNGEELDADTTPEFKLPERNVDDDYLRTATGTLTEVFVDDENRHITLTMIDTFLAEVIRVTENDDDTTVTVNYLGDNLANTYGRQTTIDLPETSLAEGDKVLVTLYQDNNQFSIGSIELAETVTGTVTAVKSVYDQDRYVGSYATMDGNDYDYVGNTFANDLADTDLNDPTLNAENTLYLDNYGNMIAFEATERAVDYLYLESAHGWLNNAQGLAVFADGVEETITIDRYTEVDPLTGNTTVRDGSWLNTNGSTLASGVYAYVRQGGNYRLTELVKANLDDTDGNGTISNTEEASYDNVWDIRPAYGEYDFGTSIADNNENLVGSADTHYNGETVTYSIRNGYNAIEAEYSGGGSENVVSLNNSTIFVDVEGNVVYTGYSNVPTMTDITFFVVYNRQLNADVVFITDGADNSTSDSFFMVLDGTPITQERDEDGTMLYTYSAMVNGERTTIVMKGTNQDNTGTPGNPSYLVKYGLYKIETITPDDEITEVSLVGGFTTAYSASQSVATIAGSGSIRVLNDANIAGCNKNDVSNYPSGLVKERIYRYDTDETVFVEVRMNADGTVDRVSEASASVINTTSDSRPGNNNVYVLAVDDDGSRTPLATLVYVVTPHDSQFSEYTVTYPTSGEYAANITSVTVTAGSTPVADGDLVTNGTSLTVAATADTGYDAVIYVNGVRQGVAPQPVTVSGDTNITVAAEARAGHTVQIADTLNTDPATYNFYQGNSQTPLEITKLRGAYDSITVADGQYLAIENATTPFTPGAIYVINGTMYTEVQNDNCLYIEATKLNGLSIDTIADTGAESEMSSPDASKIIEALASGGDIVITGTIPAVSGGYEVTGGSLTLKNAAISGSVGVRGGFNVEGTLTVGSGATVDTQQITVLSGSTLNLDNLASAIMGVLEMKSGSTIQVGANSWTTNRDLYIDFGGSINGGETTFDPTDGLLGALQAANAAGFFAAP